MPTTTPDEQHPLNRARDERLYREWDASARRYEAQARPGAALASLMAARLAGTPRLSHSAHSAPPAGAELFAAFVRSRLAVQRQWGGEKLRALADAVRTDTDTDKENPAR